MNALTINNARLPRMAGVCFALWIAWAAAAAVPLLLSSDISPPITSQPRPFQPGIELDWQDGVVRINATVVLRRGPLEFLACFSGKEHESIARIEAEPEHVYQALGLMGLTPGHPPRWNPDRETYEPPTGDLVDITFEWPTADGVTTVNAYEWLQEVQYSRPAAPRPWIFSGSLRDEHDGLVCATTGAGVALVDFPESLISFSSRHSSHNSELWCLARTAAIPALDTRVTMIIRAAQPLHLDVKLTPLGTLTINDHYVTHTEAANLIRLTQRLTPNRPVPIAAAGALVTDIVRLRGTLRAAGVDDKSYALR